MVVWPPHSASPSPASVWTRTQILSRSCRGAPGAWLRLGPQKGERVLLPSLQQAGRRGTGPPGLLPAEGPGCLGVGRGARRAGTRPPGPGELV